MPILFLDFETFYGDDYTLKKLTPPEYILDPRYETIGCAVAVDNAPSTWVDGPDFPAWLAQFDPADCMTVTFNALFDNCILAWQYGFVPARMVCSMRMAAALRGHVLASSSLANVSRLLGVGQKGSEIANVKDMRRSEIMMDPVLWRAFQGYANNDNELSRRIFTKLSPEFPPSERRVMDRVLRCAVEPRFSIDETMLAEHLKDLAADKVRMLRLAAGMEPEDEDAPALDLGDESYMAEKIEEFASSLRSNTQFQNILAKRGVDVEMKASTTDPNRLIPAFAKTDQFMADLQEHEDPIVQALAAARLGLRSTIEESRGARILRIAQLPWANYRDGNPRLYSGGTMPIPLRYSGAHTHRLSGDWKINPQNLPAGRGTNKSKLRKALIAPPGHQVVVADLSQIECRIAAWLCGQMDLLELFATGKDPYSVLASKIFDMLVDKNVHKTERFIGKSGVLGLGFGCGADKFYNMVLRAARILGMNVPKLLTVWTPELAQKSVDVYRNSNSDIRRAWGRLDELLKTAWIGAGGPIKWGPGGVVEIGHGYVALPNGMKMVYDVLPAAEDGLWYKYGKRAHRMYGPKFLENIVQALARIVIMNAALRLWDRGYKFALQAHDELAFIVPDPDVDNCKRIVMEEMCRRPSWGPAIPLSAEVGSGASYGDAK